MTSPDSPRQFFAAKADSYPTSSAPRELATALATDALTSERRQQIIAAYGLTGDQSLHALLLDWILEYVRIVLAGQPLTAEVADAVAPLKQALGIREGDFITLRFGEVKAILCEQLEQILDDRVLDDQEELAQSALQRAFDLGYDQYLSLTRPMYELASKRSTRLSPVLTRGKRTFSSAGG